MEVSEMSRRVVLTLVLAVSAIAQTRPEFEVASVKPAELDPARLMSGQQRIGATIDAARVDLRSLSLGDLIRTAYRVKSYQISGPEWIETQRFDVTAKLPDGSKRAQIPEMLQMLLEQRFHLALHRVSKEVPAYALVVAKGGAKLKQSAGEAVAANPNALQSNTALDSKGTVTSTGSDGTVRQTTGPTGMHLEMERMTMAALAERLARLTNAPVSDLTELKGSYDFALDLSREELVTLIRASGQAAASPPPGSDSDGKTLASSLAALGLKLEARKQPVEVLVIDRIDKVPSEN
jgi:uncharacterized protein (TIGR03435 family)